MTSKFIAFGSGKGGVGKSTTTINVALSLAITGTRVAIVDLDPLSNIAAILDIDADAEHTAVDLSADTVTLSDIALPYAKRCDILFPHTKSISGSGKQIVRILFDTLYDALCSAYDLVLIDMPAGIANEFFVDLIPHVQHLVVVVVSEPTSHISAAGFTKAIMQINPAISVYFWHNKFRATSIGQFNAYGVVDNYNRYIGEADRFTAEEVARCKDIAYIPHEQMLDLLHTSLQPNECVWFKVRSVMGFFHELQVHALVQTVSSDPVLREYIGYYLLDQPIKTDIPQYVAGMVRGFQRLQENGVIVADGRIDGGTQKKLMAKLAFLTRYPFYRAVVEYIEKIDETFRAGLLHNAAGYTRHVEVLERRAVSLLQLFDMHRGDTARGVHHCAALLSVYLSFSKLLRNESMRALVLKHIPTRSEHGRVVRDRRQQIAHLVRKSTALHGSHVHMIKQIYPIVIRQMMTVNTRYRLSTFNFMMTSDSINTRAYVQLVSRITHEIIHCGLGVTLGIPTSRTYMSTKKGSEKIRMLVA